MNRYNVHFQFKDHSGSWRNADFRENVVEDFIHTLLEQVKQRYPDHRIRAIDDKTKTILDMIF